MSVRRQIPAGLLDSGFASLASFAAGIFAVRYLTPAELGIYSLFFAAVFLASVVPESFAFVPTQVQLLKLPFAQRLRGYEQTFRIGVPVTLAAALIVLLAVPAATGAIDDPTFLVPLAGTAVAMACLSPLQDHMRSLLHLGDASWLAAVVSIIQFTTAAAVVAAALYWGVQPVWVPFGSLIVANAVSLAVGVSLARRRGAAPPAGLLSVRTMTRSGRWLLATSGLREGGEFLGRTIVLALTTAEVLGIAAGARIAARPVDVLVLGLTAVIAPRSMQAGRDRDPSLGRGLARTSYGIVVLVGVAYLAAAGGDWPWNVMAALTPIGYTVDGLVAFTIVASLVTGLLFVERTQLIGGGRERTITLVEVVAVVLSLASLSSAVVIGAFALPLGRLVAAIVRWVGYRVALRTHYAQAPTQVPVADAP